MSPPPQRTPASLVAVREGCKEDFYARHARDRTRADHVWKSLVAKGPSVQADVSFGPIFLPPKRPAFLRGLTPLRVLKGLPYAFRAVYVVVQDPVDGRVVRIEWVGDHAEYDRMFGYN